MSVQATINLGSFPVGYCWSGPQQYAEDLVSILQILFPGNYNTFNYGNAIPDPADQDKPWFRLNADGTPDRWYVYVGAWISPHPIPPSSPAYIIYNGSESSVWLWDGGNGDDPIANPPTDTTGAMWQVEHGFDFLIPMGAGQNSTAYNGVKTTLAINALLGEERHVLDLTEIPPHTHEMLARSDMLGGGTVKVASEVSNSTNLATTSAGGSGGVAVDHQNLPPVKGVYFIKRTSRKFYKV